MRLKIILVQYSAYVLQKLKELFCYVELKQL